MRFAVALLVVSFCALAAMRGVARGNGGLDDLLRDVRTASGQPYLAHVVSLSHERVSGAPYDITSESEGSRYLLHRCSSGICNGLYFDGDRSSVVNINGTALPLPIDIDPFQSTLRAVATGAFAAPDFVTRGGRIERATDRDVDGKHLLELVVASRHGALLDVGIDAATHLVRSVATQDDKIRFTFADYRRVANLMLPFEIDVDGKRNQVFASRKRVGGSLEAPAGLRPSIASTGVVTFAGTTPIVACSVGTTAATCLWDTGNSGMAMSPELAHRLGLQVEAGALRDAGNAVEGIVHAGPLSVAGATFPSAIYVIVRGLHASGADVALGADAFAHALVTIDYPAQQVTVARESVSRGGVPITFENFVPITGAGIGSDATPVVVDTGDDDALTLPSAMYDANPHLFSHPETQANGDTTGMAGPLRIGAFSIASVTATATKLLIAPARAHLGSAAFSRFRVTFDYAHLRLGLLPKAGDTDIKAL